MKEKTKFHRFDRFLIGEVMKKENIDEDMAEQYREEAYRIFYHKVRGKNVASRETIRGWFGLESFHLPGREHIFRMAFALDMGVEQTQKWLVEGLLEPGICINDYREIIWTYGLENKLKLDECSDMIELFERSLEKEIRFIQKTHTGYLWEIYNQNKYRDKDDFLYWLCSHAKLFKGYSRLSLHFFMQLKSEILTYVRKDAKERLYNLLEGSTFLSQFVENKRKEIDYEKEIPIFLRKAERNKKKYNLPKQELLMIRELYWIAYSSKEKNSDLLAELYASAYTDKKAGNLKKKMNREEIFFMSDKYVSQLLAVAEQKEKLVWLAQVRMEIEHLPDEEECPSWVVDVFLRYRKQPPVNIKEAKKLLKRMMTFQTQRCHMIQRQDLLPLIHYVAQRRYEEETIEQGRTYNKNNAVRLFVDMSNEILQQCQMAPLNENYRLDSFLLSGYEESDMFSFSDLIERMKS